MSKSKRVVGLPTLHINFGNFFTFEKKNVKINLGRVGPKKKEFFSGKISFIDVQGLGSKRVTINGVSLCTFYETCQGSGKVSFATIACQTFQEPGNPELTGRRRLPPNVGKWRASLQS